MTIDDLIHKAETDMLVARAALLEARHAYHVAGGDYDNAKAAHYDAVHGNNTGRATESKAGA
jgi:alkyl hydroperoxide reductase subunit AhpF